MKSVRTELYQLTQEELLTLVKEELAEASIPFKEDSYGNIWSFRFKDRPAFVAHCDTVIGLDVNYKVPVKIKDNIMWRPDHVLGADDRAGVNLILNHKENINFILTKDEEIGCIGAKFMSKNKEFIEDCKEVTWFCELDRRNGKDILGNKHGYCTKELVADLLLILPEHKDTSGVFTDIDEFVDISQGVNLSVGYYGAHSKKEVLKMDEFDYLNSKMIEISNIEGHREKHDKPIKKFGYYNSPYYEYNRYECDYCGKIHHKVKYYGTDKICLECVEMLLKEDGVKMCNCCGFVINDHEKYYKVDGKKYCEFCVEEH